MTPLLAPRIVLGLLALSVFSSCRSVAAGPATQPVLISIEGSYLSVNGTDLVPPGLFGTHNVPLSQERIADWGVELSRWISNSPSGKFASPAKPASTTAPASPAMNVECLYDRFQPALQLGRKDWKERLVKAAADYAASASDPAGIYRLEFWNEPFLNWATRPAVNYHAPYYITENIQKGDPMRLRSTGEVVENLVWDHKLWFVYRGGSVQYFLSGRIPATAKEGDSVVIMPGGAPVQLKEGTVTINGKPAILRYEWVGRDKTQKHYWSGEVNRKFYLDMLLPFAEELKTRNPRVQVAGGWGLPIWNEDWDAWEILYRPTIDAAWKWIDAIHEHHYGGDTRKVAAAYEMAWAYAKLKYGKDLVFWNTECGGFLDPEMPADSAVSGSPREPKTAARQAFTYFVRDVIHLLATCPDKAVVRAVHQAHENAGDPAAFQFLRSVRGRLLSTTTAEKGVWSVACVPDAGPARVVLAVFNDEDAPREARVRCDPRLGEGVRWTVLAPRWGDTPGPMLAEEPTSAVDGVVSVQIAPRGAAILTGYLKQAPALPVLAWKQWPAAETHRVLKPGERLAVTVAVPAEAAAGAKAAQLRLGVSGSVGGLACRVNGSPVSLVGIREYTSDWNLDSGQIKPATTVELENTGKGDVVFLSASIRVAAGN